MKRVTCFFGLVLALAAFAAVPSVASAHINYRVCNGPAPIRSGPNSSSSKIGELQNGEVFTTDANAINGFDQGYAYGSAHVSGYMSRNYEC